MVWRRDIEKHYENVSKAFTVLGLIDYNEFEVKNSIRAVIMKEMRLTCECIIDWLDDDKNKYSQTASLYLETFELGYNINVIIEARTFIYQLLAKPLSELLN